MRKFNFNYDFTTHSQWNSSVSKESYNQAVNMLFNKHQGNLESIKVAIRSMPETPLKEMLMLFLFNALTPFEKNIEEM